MIICKFIFVEKCKINFDPKLTRVHYKFRISNFAEIRGCQVVVFICNAEVRSVLESDSLSSLILLKYVADYEI